LTAGLRHACSHDVLLPCLVVVVHVMLLMLLLLRNE